MEDLLIDVLTYFNLPIIRQGSMSPHEKYPKEFFTFWNNSSDDDKYYDNAPTATIWDFDVNCYSSVAGNASKLLNEAIKELQRAGFTVSGKGHDVASDEPSHTGRGVNVLYVERN